MQFGTMFTNTGHGASPDGAAAVLAAAEEGGFTTAWVVEHVVVPSGYASTYPYDPSGRMAGGMEDFDLPDPLIWLAWAAARTTTLQLGHRNPDRHPTQPADHRQGGRHARPSVGRAGRARRRRRLVGGGVQRTGCAVRPSAASDSTSTSRRCGPCGPATRPASTASSSTSTSASRCPRPVNGTVPIVVGGHTEAAARRAGRLGDAFYPGRGSAEEITHMVDVMKRAADDAGRDGDAIPIYAMAAARRGDDLDARIASLVEIGVTQTIVPTYSPDKLAGIGQELVARFG